MSDDIIKTASQYLISELKETHNISIQSSHAHAAIAGYLGYKSKKALIDSDEIDIDEDILFFNETDKKSLTDAIARMKDDTPLKTISIPVVSKIIEIGLTPKCECCGRQKEGVKPVFAEEQDRPDGYVCADCVSRDRDDDTYSTCNFCNDKIYRSEVINSAGECEVHVGEGNMDTEEREGWESYVEYINKD